MRRTVVALVLAVALAGCGPIVVHQDGTATSSATVRVVPTTVTVLGTPRPAVEIRLRDCDTMRVELAGWQDVHLRPVAGIVDADGREVFGNGHVMGTRPTGSTVVDGPADGADVIRVPVDGARAPLRITSGCTSYPGWGSGPWLAWEMPACTTSTRSCPSTGGGTLRQGP
jgi:hypothetical protein